MKPSLQSVLIRDVAQMLRENGVNVGQNNLFKWMRDNGYLIKTPGPKYNTPTYKAMQLSLFSVKKNRVTHNDDTISTRFTTMVTYTGQKYFYNSFVEKEKKIS